MNKDSTDKLRVFRDLGKPLLEGKKIAVELPVPLWEGVLNAIEADCQQSAVIIENMAPAELETLCLDQKDRNIVLAPFFIIAALIDELVEAGIFEQDRLKAVVVWYQRLRPFITKVKQLKDEGRWSYDLGAEWAAVLEA